MRKGIAAITRTAAATDEPPPSRRTPGGVLQAKENPLRSGFSFRVDERYLQTHKGAFPSGALPQSAISGARHWTSQRLPFISALHMLPVLPTIELVTALLVPPTLLVTLDESLLVIELDTLLELFERFEVTELDTLPALESTDVLEWIELRVWTDPAASASRV
jgi:hypothetical protein